MEHGMNCPHHADKDEACTCALTERTMHAAWRKRAEEAETRIAALRAMEGGATMRRYDKCRMVGEDGGVMVETDNGAWCLSVEADARIAALEAQVKALTADRNAQAEAVRALGKGVYRHYPEGMGWGYSDDELRRYLQTDNAIAVKAVKEASGG